MWMAHPTYPNWQSEHNKRLEAEKRATIMQQQLEELTRRMISESAERFFIFFRHRGVSRSGSNSFVWLWGRGQLLGPSQPKVPWALPSLSPEALPSLSPKALNAKWLCPSTLDSHCERKREV